MSQPPDRPGTEGDPVLVRYRNYRGVVADRWVVVVELWFGEVEWHPGPRWLLDVLDVEKAQVRTFDMTGILAWGVEPGEGA